MPEGDVVLRTAQRLHAALAGRVLLRSDLRWPSLATVDLAGRTTTEVVSVGKHLLLRVSGDPAEHSAATPPSADPSTATPPSAAASPGAAASSGLTLHSHLRMEGSWHVHETGKPWRTARAEHAVRVVLETAAWTAVGHRLGMLDLVPTSEEHRLVGHLGPDVLGPGWDAAAAVVNLRAAPQRPVGEALLDQGVLAGVGTFYMAEALFVLGVTPWTPVADLPERAVPRLVAVLHRMLTAGASAPIQATTGDTRPGQRQWVHSRSGQPCRRCGTGVRVAPIGREPGARVAFYCPTCQRGPTPTDDGRAQRPLGAGAPRRGTRTTGYRPGGGR